MRSLILGNGSLIVTLDATGEVRDLYFPYAGLENHTGGDLRHRLGIYCDGALSWLSEDPRWEILVECEEDSLESRVTAKNPAMEVALSFRDIVYNESPIFLRHITITNLAARSREIKLYLGHEFKIGQSHGGETAYFDPASGVVIHYKGKRAFLINAECDGTPFTDYAIGISHFEGKQGTYRDAEDGMLSKNPIEHGNVDSVIGLYGQYDAGAEKRIHYWLTVGDSIERTLELNAYVLKKSPKHLMKTAGNYWRAWINRYPWSFYRMSPEMVALFKKSLMFVRAHVDDNGGIIASADAEVLQFGEDTYAYVWPRDASYAALALDRAGDMNVAERYFNFCNAVISKNGYFMHKYLPDRSLGSSWHPWIQDGIAQLPIQEDETALVIWALAEHYKHSHDLEFIELLYNSLIEKAANFMAEYRDTVTGLPKPSYDLWEQKHGVSTFTSASVYGALAAAADIAGVLGKEDRKNFYLAAATEVRDGILTHLFDAKTGAFAKMIETIGNKTVYDSRTDISSVYGLCSFGVLPPDDSRLTKAFADTVARLSVQGGIARYEDDHYYDDDVMDNVSNPWFITTLWYAEYLTARAISEEDFAKVRDIFEWVVRHAQPSGVLSEQLSARDGTQRSVSPLMWSHAAYVNAVLKYLDRLANVGICPTCNPVN